ncbi:MAG: T9SS type A sorting domain-containing protein [Candidatus Marinimicrobia bacterium]|nr:T9SS type A sorting domain-containing protein [Candidatus Neomarinimicrobiota bacterium]
MKYLLFGLGLILVLPLYANQPLVNISADYLLGFKTMEHGPADGTPHILGILRNGNHLSEKTQQDLNKLGFRFKSNHVSHLRNDSLNLIYETNHFAIHYDLSGSHAVLAEDIDFDGIPDYINQVADVFEYVWSVEVDSMNYDAPPTDGLQGGSSKYDIYVSNLPSQYYGLAYTTSGATDENACASYIEIRNNYNASWFQDKTELENIQVTAAHEFYHAIQFGYNCYEEIWMMEATAVWAEDQIYDHINDLYRYMNSWFSRPEKSLNDESNGCSRCYGSFIFFQYISEHIGGHETIRHIWNHSKSYGSQDHPKDFAAIQDGLEEHSSTFQYALSSMAIANRLLANNESDAPYTYEEASDYPISYPSNSGTYYFTGETSIEHPSPVYDYGSRYFSIYTNDPMDLTIMGESFSNVDLDLNVILSLDNGDIVVRNGVSINIDPDLGIDWISAVVTASTDAQSSYSFDLVLSEGYSEDYSLSQLSPNPFYRSTNESGSMNMDILVITPQTIHIDIYNVLGQWIQSFSKAYDEPMSDQFFWYGKNTSGQNVPSGIYFIHISGQEKSFNQKVTIIR